MFGQMNLDQVFDQELTSFKNSLVSLYRQKAKLVAEREALRFQYMTGVKARLQAYRTAIYNKIFSDKDVLSEELLQKVLGKIFLSIPMTNLQGVFEQGFSIPPLYAGGRLLFSAFSPTNHILSESFYDEGSPKTYLAFRDAGFLSDGYEPSMFYKAARVQAPDGYLVDLSFPLSEAWINALTQASGETYPPGLVQNVISLIAQPFSGSTLQSIYEQAQAMSERIVDVTIKLIKVQLEIDHAENDLAVFVNSYQGNLANPRTVDEILREIMAMSEASEAQVQSLPKETVDAPVPPIETPAPKSNALLYGLAAIGIFFATRK